MIALSVGALILGGTPLMTLSMILYSAQMCTTVEGTNPTVRKPTRKIDLDVPISMENARPDSHEKFMSKQK